MLKHSFDIGTTTLNIVTEEALSQEIMDHIFEVVQFIRYDFSKNIHESSGYRFNISDINIPTPVTPEFLFYLKLNINEYNLTDSSFSPFIVTDKTDEKIMLADYIAIEDNIVVKKKKIHFSTNTLLKPFIVDSITQILDLYEKKSFLLYTDNFYLAKGNKEWQLDIDSDFEGYIPKSLKNDSIGIFLNKFSNSEKKVPKKFASQDEAFSPEWLIYKEKANIAHFIRGYEISDLQTEGDLKIYCQDENIEVIACLKEGKIKRFAPLGK